MAPAVPIAASAVPIAPPRRRPRHRLVCTGAEDPLAPPEHIRAFEEEMRAAGVQDWQVVSNGNTLHGFTNQAADGSLMRAALCNETADRRSGASMRALFAEAFGKPVSFRGDAKH
jgi:dienelactone hydrolase